MVWLGLKGPLSEELSGVMNWVIAVAPDEARKVLGDPSGVSSLREMSITVGFAPQPYDQVGQGRGGGGGMTNGGKYRV